MIVDTLEHLERYAGLGDGFATAAQYLRTAELDKLPLGETAVDGRRVYINVQHNHLRPHEAAWEAHDRYADIQLILRGRERFGYAARAALLPLRPGTDLRPCAAQRSFYFDLAEGEFALFLPGEPHDPCHPVGETEEDCLKLVVKVLL